MSSVNGTSVASGPTYLLRVALIRLLDKKPPVAQNPSYVRSYTDWASCAKQALKEGDREQIANSISDYCRYL